MHQNKEPKASAITKYPSNPFGSYVNAYREQLLEVKNSTDLTTLILTNFTRVCQQYILMASSAITHESEEITYDASFTYLMQYVLPVSLKDLLVLHRDVMLQLYIGKHKHIERLATDEAFSALFEDSKKVLLEALDFFSKKSVLEENRIKGLAIKPEGVQSRMKHHSTPWPVYEIQFQTILSQLVKIDESSSLIQRFIAIFRELNSYTILVLDKTIKESVGLNQIVSNAKIKLAESVEKNDIISWLDINSQPSGQNNHKIQREYTSSIETKIKSLVSIDVPVATNEGFLLEKRIDLNKTVNKWMDYNLLPLLMDLWEIQTNMDTYLKHAFLNLKTGINLSKTTETIISEETQLKTLEIIQTTLAKNLHDQKSIVAEIKEMLTGQFLISNIYDPKEFLEVTLQTSFNQYTSETNTVLTNIRETTRNLMSKFGASYEKAISDDPKSKLEDATKCIAHRMLKEVNTQYDSLFLNKNFIGDLFLIPRTVQEQKIAETIAQWDIGFNKSILVLGRPLCGKSTFLEQSSKRYFNRKTIILNPDSNITVEGRKFKSSYDLKEALQEIKRISPKNKPVLIIDDLELWRDGSHSLLDNMRVMLDFIESESDNILLMVATNQPLSAHLDKRINFSQTFSTVLHLDKCETEEIHNAILIRNGATHKILVDVYDEHISNKQIASLTSKLCKSFNNNIGEVLQAWTYGTTVIEDNKVRYEDKIGRFPDFFTREEIVILKHTSLYSSINERTLKEYTGNQYDLKFKSSLKRLVNTKVLFREDSGSLYINPVIGHDIHEILKYKDIIA